MTERNPRNATAETIRKGRSRSNLKVDDKERDNSQTGINYPEDQESLRSRPEVSQRELKIRMQLILTNIKFQQ